MARVLRDLKRKVEGDVEVGAATTPFTRKLESTPRESTLKHFNFDSFDGLADPEEHLNYFEQISNIYDYNDLTKCRFFASTLKGGAQKWFSRISSRSIDSWKDFRELFLKRFRANRMNELQMCHLETIQQRSRETLPEFIKRFKESVNQLSNLEEKEAVNIFRRNLHPISCEGYVKDLIHREPQSLASAYAMASKFIKENDFLTSMKMNRRIRDDDESPEHRRAYGKEKRHRTDRQTNYVQQSRGTPPRDDYSRPQKNDRKPKPKKEPKLEPEWTPLNRPRADILREVKGKPFYYPPEAVVGTTWEQGPRQALRPAEDERIYFSNADYEGLDPEHNQALVVTLDIAENEVQRILVDNGSSANIVFEHTLNRMKLGHLRMDPCLEDPLYGFGNNMIPIRGVIYLPMVFGAAPRQVSHIMKFYVINVASSYNMILGRPTITKLRAIPSTIHLKLKFPTPGGIGELRGDRGTSGKCYGQALIMAETDPENRKKAMALPRGQSRKKHREHFSKRPKLNVNMIEDSGYSVTNADARIQKFVEVREKTKVEPAAQTLEIELDPGNPTRKLKIGKGLETSFQEELISLLREYADVFTWAPEDMPGIDQSVAMHNLDVDPRKKTNRKGEILLPNDSKQ
ncbi:uncharacterized protein LOC141666341 [Apium graveolens]|uniref:uncharacterized protein LOC141666341 n=1 Tax=Apium graveolens TaxID=4045 RepID=UPI003D7B56BF